MAAVVTEPAAATARRTPRVLRVSAGQLAAWCAAGLAAASVPLHGWMLALHSHGLVLTVLMSAMALWCLWCAVGVVRPGAACRRMRSLRHLWAMAAAMALLHVALLTGAFGGGHPGSHGTHGTDTGTALGTDAAATVTAGAESGPGLMLAIVVLEVAVCFACAVALRARPPLRATPLAAPIPTSLERTRHDPTRSLSQHHA